jgi:asparagine synthase (glutamine-hydrolysing)
MCGLAGFFGGAPPLGIETLDLMAQSLRHRGPDTAAHWFDEINGIGLVHRRLSILDLSPTGHQPMTSPCNRFVLVFNGEIYNHLDLRQELEKEGGAFNWRGHSDTETLLASVRHWGIDRCLKKLNGMFAFALWDKIEKKLFLARDRIGEKPLYYGRIGSIFVFGSELKAFLAYPQWRREIDRNSLALFMRYNHVPSPHSIYHGIKT